MQINKIQEGTALLIKLSGRLDTTTAPDLEAEVNSSVDGIEQITFDFTDLEYISSAGLRVLLYTHKRMSGKGGLKITHVCETVMEIFEVTGFSDILDIE
ncbi:MAG: STAS domain-containing protein [Clostridia bacterium]|nr:STAS domain-containing protein [Clostridia bacterium]